MTETTGERTVAKFQGSTFGWLFGTLVGWLTALLCLVGVGLLIVLWKWIENISTRYELTDERLIIRSGILNKKNDEIELFRVKDVTVEYSVINQITGIGTITMKSSDATTANGVMVLRDVPDAVALREQLRRLVDDARQKRRVRELDIDHDPV